MKKDLKGTNSICVHTGEIEDPNFGSAISPIYPASVYNFLDTDEVHYPRMFNTPNQKAVCQKIAHLENGEKAMITSSGMAAISTSLLAFLKKGDHIVLQNDIYGGTKNLVLTLFNNFGIGYTFTQGLHLNDFENACKPNTKVIYIESPSNPLLKLVNIKEIAALAKSIGAISIIDNTFATPMIQKPILMGIDIVLHSATKYFGGHSDIIAGAIISTEQNMSKIWNVAKNLGGNLNEYTAWFLERSMKTMGIRFAEQQKNAVKMAQFLNQQTWVSKIYFPGLEDNEFHELALQQMDGFGALVSFELVKDVDPKAFLKSTKLIKPTVSLAGIESTMTLPAMTSHVLLSQNERNNMGVKDNLIRFSLGIENVDELMSDLQQAITQIT